MRRLKRIPDPVPTPTKAGSKCPTATPDRVFQLPPIVPKGPACAGPFFWCIAPWGSRERCAPPRFLLQDPRFPHESSLPILLDLKNEWLLHSWYVAFHINAGKNKEGANDS